MWVRGEEYIFGPLYMLCFSCCRLFSPVFPFSSHSFTVYETLIIVLFQPSVVQYTNVQIHNKNAYLTGYYNELYKKKQD